MESWPDHNARKRFAEEISQPFSVIAPAGVGKTYSIVERASRMISSTKEKIALVTYTKKAAEQMSQRLAQKLKAQGQAIPYDRVFIGTIHALCAYLMERHRVEWQLPTDSEIVPSVERLWSRYQEEVPNPLSSYTPEVQERLWRYFPAFDKHLIATLPAGPANHFYPPPPFDFSQLFQATFKGPHKKTHDRIKKWAEEYLQIASSPHFIMPELPDTPKEESPLAPLYQQIFGPYVDWRAQQGMCYARALADSFQRWRRATGAYLYEDLIDIVNEKAPKGYGLSIILDEAQDTSPSQLELLKKLAKREGDRLQLTMVGDPQQSIFSGRASLQYYQQMHEELVKNEGLQELVFNVTLRCPPQVVQWVNNVGPSLLSGCASQAVYVPLQTRPDAPEGEICKWTLAPKEDLKDDASTEERDAIFARCFGQNFQRLGLNPSIAHQVAILAPRREMLFKLADALTGAGWRVQLHADSPTDTPAQRLIKAVVYLMARPYDRFQLVGLLREISPATDIEISHAVQNFPDQITLLSAPTHAEMGRALKETLQQLADAYRIARELPLAQALAAFIHHAALDARIAAISSATQGSLLGGWHQQKFHALTLAQGLESWSQLSDQLDSGTVDAPIEVGALQLMTIHKAKGLEWPVVILPFLHRPLKPKSPHYPVPDPEAPQERLSWKIDSAKSGAADARNLQRLMYVALTRPKQQLVLVDDKAFFEEASVSLASLSALTFSQENYHKFQNLPECSSLSLPPAPSEAVQSSPRNALANLPLVSAIITPSGLIQAQHIPPEDVELAPGGIAYGEWWHNFLYRLFSAPRHRWGERITAELPASPVPARARVEFEQLQKSSLWPILVAIDNQLFPEAPFIVQLGPQVMEGRVDLIIQTPTEMIIVDWKTDSLPPDQILKIYDQQARAYREAFSQLSSAPVRVLLYSTVHATQLNV